MNSKIKKIKNIIREEIISIDREGISKKIDKNEDPQEIHSYFDEYIKVENHNNIAIIEIKDENFNTKIKNQPFFSVKKNEIKNLKVKEQVDQLSNKVIFIVNSNFFENTGKQLFYNYLRTNQGIENFEDLKEINFSFAFWLMHDIGHSIIDKNISSFDNNVSDLVKFLRDNKFSKRSILSTIIKSFIFEKLKITSQYLDDFHSSDFDDTIQNLIFIAYLPINELENRIDQINLENFKNYNKVLKLGVDSNFSKNSNIDEYFNKIKVDIKNLIEKVKDHLSNDTNITLIGLSLDELNNHKFSNNSNQQDLTELKKFIKKIIKFNYF